MGDPVRVISTIAFHDRPGGPPGNSLVYHVHPDDLARAIREGVDARLRELLGRYEDEQLAMIREVLGPREPAQDEPAAPRPVTRAESDALSKALRATAAKIDGAPLEAERAEIAAAQAREARLVGALEDFLHVCNFATFDNGVVADNGANEGDYLAGQVMDRAKAALTPNGTALAAAIEAWLTADERERKARGTISDDEAHDSALQALDAAGDALRAAWRGA